MNSLQKKTIAVAIILCMIPIGITTYSLSPAVRNVVSFVTHIDDIDWELMAELSNADGATKEVHDVNSEDVKDKKEEPNWDYLASLNQEYREYMAERPDSKQDGRKTLLQEFEEMQETGGANQNFEQTHVSEHFMGDIYQSRFKGSSTVDFYYDQDAGEMVDVSYDVDKYGGDLWWIYYPDGDTIIYSETYGGEITEDDLDELLDY